MHALVTASVRPALPSSESFLGVAPGPSGVALPKSLLCLAEIIACLPPFLLSMQLSQSDALTLASVERASLG